ncbi:hypothetical protein NLX83_29425 [Allokutzneria sp. A3M-2-11 16]|uniref:sensor histidine kinase n=1 Tax=Allokutzneria sp. A3M-2-11 16 TaxID=2962043 RepID=UPI0020B80896|nr:ATP-binding protein [Allokutzneria sp. A3M-2-11 16]MCP3803403.1 hypothetical protein [Allokutzneria sp. A3M-2-11 16]
MVGAGVGESRTAEVSSVCAVWLRSAIIMVSGVLSVATTVPLVLVCAVGAWCAWRAVRRLSGPASVWCAVGDVAVVLLVSATQGTSSWAFAVASITAITAHHDWAGRSAVAWSVCVACAVGYGAGNVLAGPSDDLAVLLARLVVEPVLAKIALVLVVGGARTADRINQRTALRRRRSAVAAARRAAERDYLAVLHDTASATLLMVAVAKPGADLGWLPERARRDLEVLGAVPAVAEGRVDVVPLLRDLASTAVVRVGMELPAALELPARPALGLLFGAREALNNAALHARVDEVELRGGHDESGRVVVQLSDRGCGFATDRISLCGRGISVSIVDRMRSCGGVVTVTSVLGSGTTVRWTWPRG